MFCCLTRNPNRNRKANHKRHQSENVAVNVFPRNKSSMIFNDYDGRE